MKLVTAEIITIGDEILYGQVVDTNSAWMGTELGNIGVKVQQITSISDTKEAIRRALDEARTRANIVLLTGGLGPTKDDLTKATLTEYFNTELVLDEVSLADITLLFQSRGRDLTPLNEQQAYLPANSKPIRNLLGTAPGMWFDVNDVVIVSMPGVPFEMQRMMTDTVLPKLKERFTLPAIIHKVVQTVGIGESALAEIITEWEDNLPPYIKLAYLPHLNGVRLRLTGIAEEDDALEDQMLIQLDKLSDLIPRYIYAYGEVSLEETVGMLLNARSYTIATAESCTGGYLAHRITSIPGSSMYYQGSIIAYDNQVKIRELQVKPETIDRHGAVSEEVVREMAENVRKKFNTSIGVATSGIAGPGGGTADKPVGTIWIAYADDTQTVSKKLQYNKDRLLNIEFTAIAVLNLIRQTLT